MRKFVLSLCLMMSVSAFPQTQALSELVYEIRDPATDSAHFREALQKIGEYLALQAIDELSTKEASVYTLTQATAKHELVNETPVLVTILRAGLPLMTGVQKVFPDSPLGFFAMSRDEETLQPKVEYVALPEMKGQTVILADTMLATAGSMLAAIQFIEKSQPKKIILISAIAAQPGIERILRYNSSIKIIAGVVDPLLNSKGYIVPGLGDAGDRSFGVKVYTGVELKK